MASLLHDPIAFFTELEANNTREFWQRERDRYDGAIKPTFLSIIGGIESFGPWRVYRPNNDTRFGTTKGPYKTFIGAVAERADGVGAFLQISSRGVLVGTGMPMPSTDQLPRLRTAIAEPGSGDDFLAAKTATEAAGVRVHGGRWEPLKRVPKGFDRNHPRAEWLRWKGVETNTRFPNPTWRTIEQSQSTILKALGASEPIDTWLGRHVGPSNMTPEERFALKRR